MGPDRFGTMMRGGLFDPFKADRTGPESIEYAEEPVAKHDKIFVDRTDRRRSSPGSKVKEV
jgi:hypothetical protein